MTTPAVEVPVPLNEVQAARELRGEVRRLRRARSGRPLLAVLEDGYVWLVTALVLGSMVVSAVATLVSSTPGADAARDADLVAWLAWAAAGLAAAGAAHCLCRLGPVTAAPAAATWLLSTPADRRTLLAPALARLLLPAAGAGAVAALALAAVAVAPLGVLPGVGLAGALVGAGVAAVCVRAQAARRSESVVRAADRAAAAVAVAVGALLVWDELVGAGSLPASLSAVLLGVLGLSGALAVRPAARALARLDVGVLSDGAQLVTGVAAAVLSLDSAMLADLLVERRWRRVGTVPARPFRGRGWAALLWAEARRATRSPGLAAGAATGVLAPYALAAVAPGAVLPALLVGAYLVARRYAGGLRRLESSRALRHALPYGDRALRLAHCAAPGLAALGWAAAAAPAAPATSYAAAALGAGLAGLAGAVRYGRRPPVDHGAPLLVTPFGLVPAGLLQQLGRGPDLAAVAGLPLLAGYALPAVALVAAAAVALAVLP